MLKNRTVKLIRKILLFTFSFCAVISLSSASSFYAEKIIGPDGGQLNAGATKLVVPKDALSEDTLISMEVASDDESYVNFVFAPHGTVFAVPAEIQLSWATLKDIEDPNELILYYYDEESEDWVEETEAVFNENEKKATLYINHFSEYYFTRRSLKKKDTGGKGKGKKE